MYEITVEHSFAAGHYLRNYTGKCANPHGHNYRVCATLRGAELDKAGLLLDFKDLKAVMKRLIDRLDHQMLNEIEPFTQLNPSAENLRNTSTMRRTPNSSHWPAAAWRSKPSPSGRRTLQRHDTRNEYMQSFGQCRAGLQRVRGASPDHLAYPDRYVDNRRHNSGYSNCRQIIP